MTELRRELSGLDATAVVVGAIVGVGIFFTPSRVAELAGSAELALWAWVLGGVIAMLGALTFAELGALIPRAGGQYDVLRDAYGPATGFVYVVCNATAIQAGAIGIIALVCVDNLGAALHGGPLARAPTLACAVGLTVGIALANAAGVRWGARIQNVTVIAKLVTLLAVAGVAIGSGPAAPSAAPDPGPTLTPLAGLAAAMVPVLFAFGGWQQVLWMAGEVRQPERNLPRAILVGVAIVVCVYLVANWAYFDLLGHAGVAAAPTLAADAVASVHGDAGRRAIAAAVAVSALGVLNAQLLTGPRLLFALARDGRFFPIFGRVHATRGTPIPAIVLLTVTSTLLLLAAGADGIDRLLTGVVLVDAIFFTLTGVASLVLIGRYPHAQRPVRMPGFPVVPALFGLAEIAVIVGAWLDPKVRAAAMIGLLWMSAALALYWLRFRRRAAGPDSPQ